jgi:hypothetical protein
MGGKYEVCGSDDLRWHDIDVMKIYEGVLEILRICFINWRDCAFGINL